MLKHHTARVSILVTGLLLAVSAAHALTIKPFTAAEFAAAQKSGNPVAVHFRADWCPTCNAQDKVLQSLKDDPALKNVTLLQADYDKEKALGKQMKIKSQSTFVVFKGRSEVRRSAGETEPETIKAILTAGK